MEKLFLIVIYLVEVHLLIVYHDFGFCFCFGARRCTKRSDSIQRDQVREGTVKNIVKGNAKLFFSFSAYFVYFWPLI